MGLEQTVRMHTLRTVGLIVATLTLGGIVALWWRGLDPFSPADLQVSEIRDTTGDSSAAESLDSVSSPISSPRQVGPRPKPVSEPDASSMPGSSRSPTEVVVTGESNLAALELSGSADEVNPPPRVPGPTEMPLRFRERPVMAAHLSSQTSKNRVHFSLDQYNLEPDAMVTLEALIAEMEDADEILKLQVDGHCDDTGSDQYNQALSEMRAAVVVEFLQSQGIEVREVVTRGFGERIPVAPGLDEDARAKNRRADIRIDWVRKTPLERATAGLRSKN